MLHTPLRISSPIPPNHQNLLLGNRERSGGCVSPPAEGNQSDDTEGGAQHDNLDSGRVVAASLVDVEASIRNHGVHLLSSELVVGKTSEGNTVTEVLLASNRVAENDHGGNNEQDILQDTAHGQDDGRSLADQENDGNVQAESNEGVGNEGDDTDRVDIAHGQARTLPEDGDNTVDDSASRSVVVDGDERIHLELGTAEQALDHDKSDSLGDDTKDLDQETEHLKLELTERSNSDTNDDDGNVQQNLHVGCSHAENPGSNQGGDSVGGLSPVSNMVPSA